MGRVAQWSSAAYTDVGAVRTTNQDRVLEFGEQGLWAVADGMGGHAEGEYASQLAIETLGRFRGSRYTGRSLCRLEALLSDCNSELISQANLRSVDVIGCALAILCVQNRQVIVSWSGDSRIYRLRANRLVQLTRDHSQQSLDEDRDLAHHPAEASAQDAQLLTHAIGGNASLYLEHSWFTWKPQDRYLLCTDGLYKEVTDDEILAILSTCDAGNALPALSALYHQRGARDNIGMVSVEVLH